MRARKPVQRYGRSAAWLAPRRDAVETMMKVVEGLPDVQYKKKRPPSPALKKLLSKEQRARRQTIREGLHALIEILETSKKNTEHETTKGLLLKDTRRLLSELDAKPSIIRDSSFSGKIKYLNVGISSFSPSLFRNAEMDPIFGGRARRIFPGTKVRLSDDEALGTVTGRSSFAVRPLPTVEFFKVGGGRVRTLSVSPKDAVVHETQHLLALSRRGLDNTSGGRYVSSEFLAYLRLAEKNPIAVMKPWAIRDNFFRGLEHEPSHYGQYLREVRVAIEFALTAQKLGIKTRDVMRARKRGENADDFEKRLIHVFEKAVPEVKSKELTPEETQRIRRRVLKELKA